MSAQFPTVCSRCLGHQPLLAIGHATPVQLERVGLELGELAREPGINLYLMQ